MAGVRGVALVAVPVWLFVHVEVCGESVLYWRTWAPGCHSNATVHRHPHLHARALCSLLPLTGTPTYALKSWGGHPQCDLAPQITSFGTVALRERQHLAMTGSDTANFHTMPPRNVQHAPLTAGNDHSTYGRQPYRRGVRVAKRHSASLDERQGTADILDSLRSLVVRW